MWPLFSSVGNSTRVKLVLSRMFDQQQSSEFTMYFYTCSLIQSLKQSYKAGTTTVLLHRLRNKPKKVKLQLVSGGSISKPMSSDFQSRAFLAT